MNRRSILFTQDIENPNNDITTDITSSIYSEIESEYETGDWGGPDICDRCSNFSDRLKVDNGEVICEDCLYE